MPMGTTSVGYAILFPCPAVMPFPLLHCYPCSRTWNFVKDLGMVQKGGQSSMKRAAP
jgi:hypothetical protein